jgi:hypothetical protein
VGSMEPLDPSIGSRFTLVPVKRIRTLRECELLAIPDERAEGHGTLIPTRTRMEILAKYASRNSTHASIQSSQ